MRIGVLSLNVDSLKESPGNAIPELDMSSLDYYVEFTQEDGRPITTPPLIGSLPERFTLVGEKSMNFHRSNQNILTKVYTSKKGNPVVTKGTIPLSIRDTSKHKILLLAQRATGEITKGAVWIHLKYNQYSLLFINLHLPVKTNVEKINGVKTRILKDPTLGYEYRKQSLLSIFEKLKPLIDETTFTVVGGDLNFRINPNGEDQLTTLLQSYPYMKEFPFPDESSKTFTCKFKTEEEYKGSENLKSCRLTKIQNVNQPKECMDEDRVPSRCDRFLYHTTNYEPTVEKQESIVYLKNSDHNALFLVFTLADEYMNITSPNTYILRGGKTRRQKRKAYRKRTRKI